MSDPRETLLGKMLSDHKPSYFYFIFFTAGGACLIFGGLFVYLNLGQVAVLYVSLGTAVALSLFLLSHFKRRLTIYEDGIRLKSLFGKKQLLWRDISKVHVTYNSYVPGDLDAILKITLRGNDGTTIGFDMNWLKRKELLRLLSPIISKKP
jgi:hypothetical protein